MGNNHNNKQASLQQQQQQKEGGKNATIPLLPPSFPIKPPIAKMARRICSSYYVTCALCCYAYPKPPPPPPSSSSKSSSSLKKEKDKDKEKKDKNKNKNKNKIEKEKEKEEEEYISSRYGNCNSSPFASISFCKECKCFVCHHCDCSVYHFAYQEALFDRLIKEEEAK